MCSSGSFRSEPMLFDLHDAKKQEKEPVVTSGTPLKLYEQSWISHLAPKRFQRRSSVDRPLTPARIRHRSGGRRLSLYDKVDASSSEEEGASDERRLKESELTLIRDKRQPENSFSIESLPSFVGKNADRTNKKRKISIPILKISNPDENQGSFSLSRSFESKFSGSEKRMSSDGNLYVKEKLPRKRSLNFPVEKEHSSKSSAATLSFLPGINIASSTTSSAIPLRQLKGSGVVGAETKGNSENSISSDEKPKRHSLPNLRILKNVFNLSFNTDVSHNSKEKEKQDKYKRRQSLPESKLREQFFPKMGLRPQKPSSSSSSSNSFSSSNGNNFNKALFGKLLKNGNR